MNKLSKRTGVLALSGVLCGMALAVMLCSAILPSMTYALPMIAGALLLVPSIEFGSREALICYAAISLLSMILPTDKESALMFVFLFGLYPIIKKYFEQLRTVLEYLLKYVYFNIAVISAVGLAALVFSIPVDDGTLGKWAIPLLLLAGNVVFFVYDLALTKFVTMYVVRLQPVFRKTFHL